LSIIPENYDVLIRDRFLDFEQLPQISTLSSHEVRSKGKSTQDGGDQKCNGFLHGESFREFGFRVSGAAITLPE
jgi:hypothetical protein